MYVGMCLSVELWEVWARLHLGVSLRGEPMGKEEGHLGHYSL